MNDISQQIKEAVSLIIKEQLDKIVPLYGAYRPFENLRLKLKKLFPNEKDLDNEISAISFVKKFTTKDDILIIENFVDKKTNKVLTAYRFPTKSVSDKMPSVPNKKEEAPAQQSRKQAVTGVKPEEIKRSELRQFAFFLNFDGMLEDIAKMAKPEVWQFGKDASASSTNKYPILKAYLYQVFSRLKYESEILDLDDKIVIVNCKVKDQEGNIAQTQKCAINTGLISRRNKYIYMLFDKNSRPGAQEWFYKLISDDTDSQNFIPFKGRLPKVADFYNEISRSTLIYSKEVVAMNREHILLDHCERLPIKFLKQYFKNYHKFQDGSENPLVTAKDWSDFKKYMMDEAQRYEYEDAFEKFKNCISTAQRKAQSGDAFRVHIYRPEMHSVGFFLPLYLVKPEDETDFEVGVIVDNSTSDYVARTIYQTSMAYDKIRVMGTQYRTWLNPLKIKNWVNPYASDSVDKNVK